MIYDDNQTLQEAWGLEKYLKPASKLVRSRLKGIIPKELLDDYFNDTYGCPIGIGKHPKKGWFVLGSGQGPFVIWRQWE